MRRLPAGEFQRGCRPPAHAVKPNETLTRRRSTHRRRLPPWPITQERISHENRILPCSDRNAFHAYILLDPASGHGGQTQSGGPSFVQSRRVPLPRSGKLTPEKKNSPRFKKDFSRCSRRAFQTDDTGVPGVLMQRLVSDTSAHIALSPRPRYFLSVFSAPSGSNKAQQSASQPHLLLPRQHLTDKAAVHLSRGHSPKQKSVARNRRASIVQGRTWCGPKTLASVRNRPVNKGPPTQVSFRWGSVWKKHKTAWLRRC